MAQTLYNYWFVQFEFPNEMESRINQAVEKWFGMRVETRNSRRMEKFVIEK